MRLSFSTNAFTRFTLVQALEAIRAAGYAGVEILADSPHLFAAAVNRQDLEALEQCLADTGLLVANINGNTAVGYYQGKFWEPLFEPSLANPDPQARNWRLRYTKSCIDLACRLHAPAISITSGRMVPGLLPSESRKILLASLAEITEYAELKDIKVGIEYEPGLLIGCGRDLVQILERIGSPKLGANLDIGHAVVAGENPVAIIQQLGAKIFHIHLEDIADKQHYHLIPGDGEIDFNPILQALEEVSYQGFLTVELYTYPHMPHTAAQNAINYLSSRSFFKERRQAGGTCA